MNIETLRGGAVTADDSPGTLKGIASLFGSVAQGIVPTKFQKGTFKDTLANDGPFKILWQHQTDEPIGRVTNIEETDIGLEIAASVVPTTRGRDALLLLRNKIPLALSIGFDAQDWEMQTEPDQPEPVRLVKKAKLYEVSLVSFGADPGALVTSVHQRSRSRADYAAVVAHLDAQIERRLGHVETVAPVPMADMFGRPGNEEARSFYELLASMRRSVEAKNRGFHPREIDVMRSAALLRDRGIF